MTLLPVRNCDTRKSYFHECCLVLLSRKASMNKCLLASFFTDVMADESSSVKERTTKSKNSHLKLNLLPTQRFLSALELLRMQALYSADFPALERFCEQQPSLMRDMAGNAFTTTTCMAVLVSAMIASQQVSEAWLVFLRKVEE